MWLVFVGTLKKPEASKRAHFFEILKYVVQTFIHTLLQFYKKKLYKSASELPIKDYDYHPVVRLRLLKLLQIVTAFIKLCFVVYIEH